MTGTRASRVAVLSLAGVAGLLTTAAARPGDEGRTDARVAVRPEVIEKAVFRCWREVSVDKAGREFHQAPQMTGWRLARWGPEVWDYSGDLSPCQLPWEVRLDTTRRPMRLDLVIRRGPRPTALPGIFKLQGGRLVWVTPDWDKPWPALRPSGEYPGRPTGFSLKPADGYDRRVLAPCERYEQVGAR